MPLQFTHPSGEPLTPLQLQRIEDDPKYPGRWYTTPDGPMPSATTVLKATKDNSGLDAWRAKVGDEEANRAMEVACRRGTAMHERIENFLLGNPPQEYTEQELGDQTDRLFESALEFLVEVDTAHALELPVFFRSASKLGFAGTADAVIRCGGRLLLADWKSAKDHKKSEWLEDYHHQVGLYAAGLSHAYGIKVEGAVIVVAVPDKKPQVIEVDIDQLRTNFKDGWARVERFWSPILSPA